MLALWGVAAVLITAPWSDGMTQLLASRPLQPGDSIGLWLSEPLDAAEMARLQAALLPYRPHWLRDLEPDSLGAARERGVDFVLGVQRPSTTWRVDLWRIDSGPWLPAPDRPQWLDQIEISVRPGERLQVRPEEAGAMTSRPEALGTPLFSLSFEPRALASCGDQAVLALGDHRVYTFVRRTPRHHEPGPALDLEVLRPAEVSARSVAGRVLCRPAGDPKGTRFRVIVGHANHRRAGMAELDLEARSFQWADFILGMPLAFEGESLVYGRLEAGTHRFQTTVYRKDGPQTEGLQVVPFLEVALPSANASPRDWWLLGPDLFIHRGEARTEVRVGKGLVPTARGGFAASSPEVGPEVYSVYDVQGRRLLQIPLPGPVQTAAPEPGGLGALVAVALEAPTGSQVIRLDWSGR